LKPARAAAKEICKLRYQQFNCAGQASKIKPITLSKMADRYAKGELAQVVK
jgi:fructose-bisphosphate aldolase, class II